MLPCRGKQPQNLLLLFHKLAQQGAKEKGTRNTDRATTWTMSSTSCAWTTEGIGKSAHCINWFSDFFMANWQRFRGWNKKTGTGITRT